MKRKCRKAHESILSKGQGTVILAVCTAIAMLALTACGGKQTDPAGSSEDAGTGNAADSDEASSGLDIADRQPEEFPEDKDGAKLPQPYARYMELLEQIMTEGHDSNGREYDWNDTRNFENNCFAILDVDNDGRQELLFHFNESYMGDMCEVVYEYDEEADILREEPMPELSGIHVSYHRMTKDFMERMQNAYVQAAAYATQAEEWFVGSSGDYLLYDLDGDGNLELTVSVMQGTGRYSYNHFYVLDDNGKVRELELVKLCDSKECEHGWERDFDIGDWPHIQAYQDDNGIIYYEGNDYCREGILGGYYETGFYYLKDGVVYQDSIRRMESFHKIDGQGNETHYYSISLDENATIDEKEVTEEQYEAIREEYIKEMAEIRVYQNWSYFRWDEIAQGEISEEAICQKLFESALGSE